MRKLAIVIGCTCFFIVRGFAFNNPDSLQSGLGRDSSFSVKKIKDIRQRFEPKGKYNFLDYIQNQSASAQTGNFWIDGNGIVQSKLFVGTTADAGAYNLQVAGNAWIKESLTVKSDGSYSSVLLHTANGLVGTISAQNSSNFYLRAQNALSLGSGAINDRMLIASDGNVGIGTITPSYTLDIYGNPFGAFRVKPSSIASTSTFFVAETNGGTKPFMIYGNGLVSMYDAPYVSIQNIYNTGAERGKIYLNSVANGDANGLVQISGSAGNLGSVLMVKNTGSTIPKIFDVRDNADGSQFHVTNSFASAQKMLIGTTTDAGYKLDVNGASRFNGSLYTQGVNYTNNIFSAIPYNSSSPGVHISQYGELLVGLNARKSTSLLHVGDGSVTFDHFAGNGTGVAYFDANGSFYKSNLQVIGQDLYWWDLNTQTANSHKLLLNYGGSQGSYALQVKGDIYNGTMSNETTDPDKIVVNSGGVLKYMSKSQLGISSSTVSAPANQVIYGTGAGSTSSSSLSFNNNTLEVGGSDAYGTLLLKNNLAYNSSVVGANDGVMYLTSYGDMRFRTNQANTTNMLLKPNGNVLIGTTTDGGNYKLQIAGNASITPNGTHTLLVDKGLTANAVRFVVPEFQFAGNTSNGQFYWNQEAPVIHRINSYTVFGVDNGSYYRFRGRSGLDDVLTLRLSDIEANQWVWAKRLKIGGNTEAAPLPDVVLDINGAIRIASILNDPIGANGVLFYNSTTDQFKGYRNGQWKNFLMEGDKASDSSILSVPATQIIYGTGTGITSSSSLTWDGLTFKVTSNGNNAATLSWNGSALSVGGANNSDYIVIKSLAGTGSLKMQTTNTTSYLLSQQDLSFGSGASNDRAILKSNGNLLLGTTTDAGYKLDVNGPGRFGGQIVAGFPLQTNTSGVAVQKLLLYGSADNDYAGISVNQAGRVVFNNGYAHQQSGFSFNVNTYNSTIPALTIAGDNGQVALGYIPDASTDPDKILVSDNGVIKYMTKAQLGIGSSSSSNAWSLTGNTTTTINDFIGTASGNTQPLVFKTNGNEAFRVNSSGQISIGTNDPKNYKLAVNGDAIFTRIKVKTYASWPDYVFHSSYRLPALKEIEEYINRHKHLPDVPSASDVNKNGLDIADNQAMLLKKIEELTLYIIDQDKQIKTLKEQTEKINRLEQQLEDLKKNYR